MPGYELSLIVKVLGRPELKKTLKRSLTLILENGGIVRKLEHLGEKRLPFIMRAHNENFTHGRYFLINFNGPTSILPIMKEYFTRDIDVIRPAILRHETEQRIPDPEKCDGAYDDLYQPIIRNKNKLLPEVQDQLKDIKLYEPEKYKK